MSNIDDYDADTFIYNSQAADRQQAGQTTIPSRNIQIFRRFFFIASIKDDQLIYPRSIREEIRERAYGS
jgi:hypothetical protein